MIFKRTYLGEIPEGCTECPLFAGQCDLGIDKRGIMKQGHDKKRDKECPLIEINESDIEFFLNYAKQNREDSASLAEMPEQRWKELHKEEVKMMDKIIKRLDLINQVIKAYIAYPTITGNDIFGKKKEELS